MHELTELVLVFGVMSTLVMLLMFLYQVRVYKSEKLKREVAVIGFVLELKKAGAKSDEILSYYDSTVMKCRGRK